MRVNMVIVAALVAANSAHGQIGAVPQLSNAPFSADEVGTHVQTLADGTHITQGEQTTKLYRDSLGRTRSEAFFVPGPPAPQTQPVVTNITIVDPVEGVRYVLDTNKKTARKIVLPKQNQSLFPARVPPGLSQASPIAVPQGQPPQARLGVAQAIQLYPAPIRNAAGGVAVRPASKNESLGTQTMEGLIVEGNRTTTTWAVGTMGNDRDLVTYNETWRSTELGMIVMSKNSDPRTGEGTTKIINVSRSEPDPALFQVPPDYTIEEQPTPGSTPSGQNGVVVR